MALKKEHQKDSKNHVSVLVSSKTCASCHLGPDHPNIEIYNNSMHGHIYNTEGQKWNFSSALDACEILILEPLHARLVAWQELAI